MKLDTLYLIQFPWFDSILCKNLSPEQIQAVTEIRNTMSRDEYAGYHPDEQAKRRSIIDIVKDQRITVTRIP